jgi:hypothetical protein
VLIGALVESVRRTRQQEDALLDRAVYAVRAIASDIMSEYNMPQFAVPLSWLDVAQTPALVYEVAESYADSFGGHFPCFSCHRAAKRRGGDPGPFAGPAGAMQLCKKHVEHVLAARDWLAHVARRNGEELDRGEFLAHRRYGRAVDSILIVDLER